MDKNLMVKLSSLLILMFVSVGFLACRGSDAPETPPEMSTEQKEEQEGLEALRAKSAEYTTIPANEQLAEEPFKNKKLIFFRFSKGSKDEPGEWIMNDFGFGDSVEGVRKAWETHSELDFKLAKKPTEVGTIALLPECKYVDAGSYTVDSGSIPASKEHCELILIDPELSAVVFRKIFEGKLESNVTLYNSEKSVIAEVDRMKIVDFLNSLSDKDDSSPDKTDPK